MRTRRRSGIANLVGAVFFVLIVVLMVGALAAMFNSFSNSVQTKHQSDQATLQAQQQALGVQRVVFGGLDYTSSSSVTLSSNAGQDPLLPVTNMNFTGGMQRWSASHSYNQTSDSGEVVDSPQYMTYNVTSKGSVFFPSQPQTFTLTVFNDDNVSSPADIARVSVLVDQNWVVPDPTVTPQPVTNNWGASEILTTPPKVVGNNITWVSVGLLGISPTGGDQVFTWIANVPESYGTYYNTVVVSWLKGAALPYTDVAIGTTNATITRTDVSRSGTAGASSAVIRPSSDGAVASGVSAGYDANALQTSSESGPGSLYIDFRPSLNSMPIADGMQLTSTVNFTTSFSLDGSTAEQIAQGGCCTLSFGASLDSINAPRNSLVLYQAYLTNPKGVSFELPIGGAYCGTTTLPDDYVNPTACNDFRPSGWVYDYTSFDPSSTNAWLNGTSGWFAGTYILTLTTTMIVPGQSPQAVGYPPSVSIHLDDIGLALKPTQPTPHTTTWYGSTSTIDVPTGLNLNQVQGLELGVNATGAPQNTTIYAYLADNSRTIYNPPLWVQVGSESFTSAGMMDLVIPLPNAAYYVDAAGDISLKINATSSAPNPHHSLSYQVGLKVYVVITTFNQTRTVVEFKNLSDTPVNLLSLVISGPGGSKSTTFPSNFYLDQGELMVVPEGLTWTPGQIYTVTVTTASGLTYSRRGAPLREAGVPCLQVVQDDRPVVLVEHPPVGEVGDHPAEGATLGVVAHHLFHH
ncbi:MAG: hypothetical protein ABSF83_09955 [Nitrososphaerales archaeon]